MLHEAFRPSKWIKQYPLTKLKHSDVTSTLTGPLPVAYVAQMRAAAAKKGGNLGKPVPVDLCVWNLGDSKRRDVTKIGGVPYWPASKPWPTLEQPCTFVAQFCFADSTDIVRKLPGDILSILAASEDYQHLILRWFKLGHKDLLPPNEMPTPGWPIQPCHAALFRTVEYPDADYELFDDHPFPLSLWARRYMDASKIGGVWELRGELPDPEEIDDPKYRKEIEDAHAEVRRAKRQFICQLASIQPTSRQPFLNVARTRSPKNFLMIADVGGFDFFYDGKETDSSWWSG